MIASLPDYVSFLCRHQLSGDQFLFCCLVYEKKFDLVYKVVNERNGFDIEELRDLEDRGFVINTDKNNRTYPDMYIVTDKFKEEIYGEELTLWEELINTYPTFIFIEGKRIPAQSTDLDLLKIAYFQKIRRSVKQHKEIVDLIKYGADNDLINMGIEKFIRGEQWKMLKSIRDEKPKEVKNEREF